MKSDILNVEDCRLAPRSGDAETNKIALCAVAEIGDAKGGTIYISTNYEAARTTYPEISTAANSSGTIRISEAASTQSVQSVGRNLFVMTAAQDNVPVGRAHFEGLAFHRPPRSAAA